MRSTPRPADDANEITAVLRALRLLQAALLASGVSMLAAAAVGRFELEPAVLVAAATVCVATGALAVEASVRSRLCSARIGADGPRFGSVVLLELPIVVQQRGHADDRPWTAVAVRHGVHRPDASGAFDPELLVVRVGDAPTWMTIDRIAVPSGSVHEPR